ncbi:MAG: hypothetical protein FGM42_01445 [Ilumatobacteraceae bacterium]|nr:hypothetical protein [Ilumatobacteraceae bacterium]
MTSSETIRVGVVGAGGRMGETVCAAVTADPRLQLVAAVDPGHVGASLHGVTVAADLKELADANCSVVVDFTVAAAARTSEALNEPLARSSSNLRKRPGARAPSGGSTQSPPPEPPRRSPRLPDRLSDPKAWIGRRSSK